MQRGYIRSKQKKIMDYMGDGNLDSNRAYGSNGIRRYNSPQIVGKSGNQNVVTREDS